MNKKPIRFEFDEGKIDSVFEDLDKCHLPGAVVGMAICGKPIYRKGFGLASMELPVVLSPTLRMRIFSISKHFTCLAYLLLCEEGKAGPDDCIGQHLPEIHGASRSVTMRQLMGNTSGLRDVFDLSWHSSGTGWSVPSTAIVSGYCHIDDVNAAPDTTWSYNNGGFLLVSTAIERITGQQLEEVLRDRIFEPLGMSDTLLRRFDSNFVPNSATLHTMSPDGYSKSYIGGAIAGEGGIVSTVDDMLRWLAHMSAPAIGSAATWETMKSPRKLINGASTGYGMGLFSDRYRGVETLFHSGMARGGNAQMLKVPAVGLDVVILMNRENPAATLLTERILDACLVGLDPIRQRMDAKTVSGTFLSPTTGHVIQLSHREGQQIASINGVDVPVEAHDLSTLRPTGIFSWEKKTLSLVGEPEPTAVRLSDCGNVEVFVRKVPPSVIDIDQIAGRYRATSIGATATIGGSADGPQLTIVGRFGSATYHLTCLADRIWRAKSPAFEWLGCILSFDSTATDFHFSTYRTSAFGFRRDI